MSFKDEDLEYLGLGPWPGWLALAGLAWLAWLGLAGWACANMPVNYVGSTPVIYHIIIVERSI